MVDVAPSLIESIKTAFYENYNNNQKIKAIKKKIDSGKATYKDVYSLANEVGNIRAKTYKNLISSDVLPDGKMYFNIADRVIRDSLNDDYEIIKKACIDVQNIKNKEAGISLKAQGPEFNEEGIKGLINRISSEDVYDDIAWILDEPVKVFDRKVVDNAVEKNAKFQHSAGIRATIKRTAAKGCCKWCTDLAGDYTYPGVPNEVFMRHSNCKCSLEYNGEKLTAFSKSFK